jgi:hypothetical protein
MAADTLREVDVALSCRHSTKPYPLYGILNDSFTMTKLLLGVLLLLGCRSGSDTQNNKGDTTAEVATKASAVLNSDTALKETPPIVTAGNTLKHTAPLFDNHQPYEIISVVNSVDRNTTDTDTSKCGSWTLSKEGISHIIDNSKPIDGTTWDLSFLVLTCTKSIKVSQSKHQFDIKINAGSFFSVSNGDTTVLYGDFKKSDRKYFIEGPSDE